MGFVIFGQDGLDERLLGSEGLKKVLPESRSHLLAVIEKQMLQQEKLGFEEFEVELRRFALKPGDVALDDEGMESLAGVGPLERVCEELVPGFTEGSKSLLK